MALRCSDCRLEHDLDSGPDVGTCVACGRDLIEDGERKVERAARMRELISDTINTLARARNQSREAVIATLTARDYVVPRKKRSKN